MSTENDPILYCTPTSHAEREVSLSEIPETIADLQRRWALAYTRAESLDAENRDLRAQLDQMRRRDMRNIDELTDLCARQRKQMDALRDFVLSVWDDCFAFSKPSLSRVQDTVRESVQDDLIGMDCDSCGGTGRVRDEIPDHFGTQVHEGDCPSCIGGRVPR